MVNKWDVIWKDFKSIQFWNVEVLDVKVTVEIFVNEFNMSVNELKNKKWEVVETTRENIEAFRSLLPVVDDLKNPAMKVRHWNEVRNLINR